MNTNGTTSVASNAGGIPNDLSLLQNFPNPFNGQTTISYTVPALKDHGSGRVNTTLVLYDEAGRQVATLVDASEAPGEYAVRFNASHLSSGVYFYQLKAGGRVVVRKMILMK
jgi:hypothetical protein